MNLGNIYFYTAIISAALIFSALNFFAQDKSDFNENFCSDNRTWNNRVSFKEGRELSLPAGNTLEVDGKRNGGIKIGSL